MDSVWKTLRRFALWAAAFVGLVKDQTAAVAHERAEAIRTKRQREIEEFNRLLTAAVNMKDTIAAQIQTLEREEAHLRTELRRAAVSGDNGAGGTAASRIDSIAFELSERRQQLADAQIQMDGVAQLRACAIAKAQAELQAIQH